MVVVMNSGRCSDASIAMEDEVAMLATSTFKTCQLDY